MPRRKYENERQHQSGGLTVNDGQRATLRRLEEAIVGFVRETAARQQSKRGRLVTRVILCWDSP